MRTTVQAAQSGTQPPYEGPVARPFEYTPSPAEIAHADRYRDYQVVYKRAKRQTVRAASDWTIVGLVIVDDEQRMFELYPYVGATISDLRALDAIVLAVREGHWGGIPWTQTVRNENRYWATGMVGTAERERVTGWKASEVVPCEDELCWSFQDYHVVKNGRIRHEIERDGGDAGTTRKQSWGLTLARFDDGDWEVAVDLPDEPTLSGAEVAAFVSDLRWMNEEARRLNERRAA